MAGSLSADSDSEDHEVDSDSGPRVSFHQPMRHPRSRAKYNILSRLLFVWLDSLFCLGCRRSLEQSDLFVHPQEVDSERLLTAFNRHWKMELERVKQGRTPRLWVALLKVLWWRSLIHGAMFAVLMTTVVVQSVLVGFMSSYFAKADRSSEDTRNAYLGAAGFAFLGVWYSVLRAHCQLDGQKFGMMARIVMTGAIYQKVLKLSQVTVGKVSIGYIVNLASNDVQRMDLGIVYLHFLWIAPLLVGAITWLVYIEVGAAAFIILGFMILQIPLQMCTSRVFALLRFKSAILTDQRVRVMNEIISGIRVIKMYAWEHAVERVLANLRRKESKFILYSGVLRGSLYCFFSVTNAILGYFVFVTLVATEGSESLVYDNLFITISLLLALRIYVAENSVLCFQGGAEAIVALSRIQKLLVKEEISLPAIEDNSTDLGGSFKVCSSRPYPAPCAPVVRMSGLSASWSQDQDKTVLKDISFEMSEVNRLLSVIGAVGAGKSTLLQCLLGELKPVEGLVEVNGRVSYACQDAWVFSGTVRENILFGLPYKKSWFNTVLEACTLDKDVSLFDNGDLTLVGERGVTLSGGQKARVNLARAVYRDADVYLLDDPLSAVDTAVARHLFDKCIRGLLGDRVVVLVTHQLHFALQADKILTLKEGSVEVYGTMVELQERGIDPTELLKLSTTEEEEEEEGGEFAFSDAEDSDNSLTPAMKRYTRHKCASPTVLGFPLLYDRAVSPYNAPSMLSLHSAVEMGTSSWHETEELQDYNPLLEERGKGTISLKTYVNFFRAGGNYLTLSIVFFIFVLAEAGFIVTDWWLSEWAKCNSNISVSLAELNSTSSGMAERDPSCLISFGARIGIYSGLILGVLLLNLARGVLFTYLIVNASRVLHNRMLSSVIRAPVLFFDNNPIGRVLNRFAKDVGFLDDLLPYIFLEYLILAVRFLLYLGLTVVTLWYIIFPAIFLLGAFVFLRWYYLKTSREVKRLEANARSPLYSHISTTLQGLPTIRCFEMQPTFMQHFHFCQNQHSQGWYLYLVTTRWFGVRVNVLISTLIPILAFASVALSTSSQVDPGLVGLALTYTVAIASIFQWCIQQSAEVETIMVSVERILQYSRLESEAPLETLLPSDRPPTDWPDKGQITMDNVCFQYSSNLPLVLKDVTFSVQPAEKIGIVGRTGAGKSSLLSVIFRLAEPYGSITIDGVETSNLGLHDLRKNISIIPQDPVLFSGTMRYNLDPFDDYPDTELWDVLEQVQLKEAVEQLEGRLEGEVSEGGSNFSVGQRQLVCLARALLRKNKILVLDEATANVDVRTDTIIQAALREKFHGCTVLTIAHRLNTIMDSDRILVMNKGQVKEFDNPHHLLQDPSSQFCKMVDKTGPTASQKLRAMAQEGYLRRRGGRRRSSAARRTSDHALLLQTTSVATIASATVCM